MISPSSGRAIGIATATRKLWCPRCERENVRQPHDRYVCVECCSAERRLNEYWRRRRR